LTCVICILGCCNIRTFDTPLLGRFFVMLSYLDPNMCAWLLLELIRSGNCGFTCALNVAKKVWKMAGTAHIVKASKDFNYFGTPPVLGV